jgi:hypothetical protein
MRHDVNNSILRDPLRPNPLVALFLDPPSKKQGHTRRHVLVLCVDAACRLTKEHTDVGFPELATEQNSCTISGNTLSCVRVTEYGDRIRFNFDHGPRTVHLDLLDQTGRVIDYTESIGFRDFMHNGSLATPSDALAGMIRYLTRQHRTRSGEITKSAHTLSDRLQQQRLLKSAKKVVEKCWP